MDTKLKLLLLSFMVGVSSLLYSSFLPPVLTAKPNPVELKYFCTAVQPEKHQEQRPDNVPIILLHGMGGSKQSWHGTFELLSMETKKEVCRVDLRNHGESPWNSDEYDVEAMTEDIKYLIDQRKAPKAILLGQSLGGKIAVHLALTYPERVEKIIVEDMRPNGFSPEGLQEMQFMTNIMKELDNEMPQGVSEKEAKEALLKILNEKMNMPFKLDDPSILPIVCPDKKCQWAFNPILREAISRNVNELFNESSGRFDGPALFIYGGKSNFKVGDDESNIKKFFPNAKLVEVPEASHMVHTHEKFKREVIKFINDK